MTSNPAAVTCPRCGLQATPPYLGPMPRPAWKCLNLHETFTAPTRDDGTYDIGADAKVFLAWQIPEVRVRHSLCNTAEWGKSYDPECHGRGWVPLPRDPFHVALERAMGDADWELYDAYRDAGTSGRWWYWQWRRAPRENGKAIPDRDRLTDHTDAAAVAAARALGWWG